NTAFTRYLSNRFVQLGIEGSANAGQRLDASFGQRLMHLTQHEAYSFGKRPFAVARRLDRSLEIVDGGQKLDYEIRRSRLLQFLHLFGTAPLIIVEVGAKAHIHGQDAFLLVERSLKLGLEPSPLLCPRTLRLLFDPFALRIGFG